MSRTEQEMSFLDVGSGIAGPHHVLLRGENITRLDVDRDAVDVDVVGDAACLPFQDCSFRTVYASHLLEHLENPMAAVKEFRRVASSLVVVKVPNGNHYKWRSSANTHLFSWTRYTLGNMLRQVFSNVEVVGTNRLTEGWLTRLATFLTTLFHDKNELTAICR